MPTELERTKNVLMSVIKIVPILLYTVVSLLVLQWQLFINGIVHIYIIIIKGNF